MIRTVLSTTLLFAGWMALTPSVQAEVLVSDDFSDPSPGSGVGWVADSEWSGSGTIADGVITFGDIGRHFASPIDPFALGKVFVAFDYTQTSVAGNPDPLPLGTWWGGATIYEPDNAEAVFIGNPWGSGPNGLGDYGVATSVGGVPDHILHSGVDFDDQLHTLITEIDTTVAGSITYRLWFDDNTWLGSPNDSITVPLADSPIDTEWGFLYFRSDGTTTNQADNLVIATAAEDVGLSPVPEPASLAMLAVATALLVSAGGRQRKA
ncbi:PEP-CTERM sorting domain-containing protein [Aeoliella mucimassa]|uniref:Ice-binding protein C-terminal domain-containing protein n=1 Tax=Aeoliella mucimassa TaxID=2527972 RepID=A0A518AR63_9BACT|nr:PEP-CTERM sorting domain-containing protein [Aeoliella mucimassa]QDU57209.1 hypothetical protein Pan181_34230 [Aeoliella mucimassa]